MLNIKIKGLKIALLAVLVGAQCAGVGVKGEKMAIPSEIGLLCAYDKRGMPKTRTFQDEAQLIEFLNTSGYYAAGAPEMAHLLDFKKWTYFAYVITAWPHVLDISYGMDVTITITTLPPPRCTFGGAQVLPAEGVYIYFIPFTEKNVVLVEKSKRRKKILCVHIFDLFLNLLLFRF